MQAPVEYRVSLASRAEHLFDIEARFPLSVADDAAAALELRLPSWTPGSYLMREFARHVQELVCEDQQGRPLPVRKHTKASWLVETRGAGEVRARYRVYAHELSVRTCHLDETHAFMNAAALFMYVETLRDRGIRLRIDGPPDWHAATELRASQSAPDAAAGSSFFAADDYDMLVDSPIEIGTHERIDFAAAGRPASFVVYGRAAFDRRRLVDDTAAIIEAQAALFGGLPYERYTFILHLVPGAYGGLEHKSSSTLLTSPLSFSNEKRYHDFLELVSHEFFHLWNGKRIRPAALGPFDYQHEAYTRSLWVVEGITSYYDRYMLRRSQRISAERFLEKLGDDLTRIARIPGREHQSLEESSFDAWIKLYRPDENTVNSTVSYYLKGSVAALLLDLTIRARSEGTRSLDDAMRGLWAAFERDGRGYGDDAVQALIEEGAGMSLDDIFAHGVRARGEIDVEGALAGVGLAIKRSHGGDEKHEGAWLGANLAQHGERLRVTESLRGGPAQTSGLSPHDELVAWDGLRVDEAGVKDRLAGAHAGAKVRLTIFRRDELRDVDITLGRRPHDKLEVVPIAGASDAARAAYERWMMEPFRVV